MIVGGYELHLYCENFDVVHGEVSDELGHRFNEFPHEFTSETGAEARRQARERGWNLDIANGFAYCPKCKRKRRRATK